MCGNPCGFRTFPHAGGPGRRPGRAGTASVPEPPRAPGGRGPLRPSRSPRFRSAPGARKHRLGRACDPQRATHGPGEARKRPTRRGYPALGDPRPGTGLLSARARLRQSPGRGRSSRGPIGPRSITQRLARGLRPRPRHRRAGLTLRPGRTLGAPLPPLCGGHCARRCAGPLRGQACARLLRNRTLPSVRKEKRRKQRETETHKEGKRDIKQKRLLGKLYERTRKV